jgi:hypothetical protein
MIHADEGEMLKAPARYCARAPLSLSRLTYDSEAQTVAYAYTNPYDNAEATETITPLELVFEVSLTCPKM